MNARDEIRERLQEQLCFELGEPVLFALQQPATSDVLLLEDGRLWVNAGGKWAVDRNVCSTSGSVRASFSSW